jgi:hypothetical protein
MDLNQVPTPTAPYILGRINSLPDYEEGVGNSVETLTDEKRAFSAALKIPEITQLNRTRVLDDVPPETETLMESSKGAGAYLPSRKECHLDKLIYYV